MVGYMISHFTNGVADVPILDAPPSNVAPEGPKPETLDLNPKAYTLNMPACFFSCIQYFDLRLLAKVVPQMTWQTCLSWTRALPTSRPKVLTVLNVPLYCLVCALTVLYVALTVLYVPLYKGRGRRACLGRALRQRRAQR